MKKDIILSERMEAVVNMVSPRSFAVADVGCDHAYVSIALIKRKIAQKIVAMDVRSGPLETARKNIAANGLDGKIELRLSNGLNELSKGEVDSIVIAGMGGLLMRSILEDGKEILEWKEKRPSLILQPQSDIHEVRIFLQEHAYHIVQEKILVDEEKYYTVIKAEPGREKREYNETELRYGLCNLEQRDTVLYEYLEKEKNVMENIFIKLSAAIEHADKTGKAVSDKTIKRLAFLQKEMRMNQEALKYYVNREDTDEV